jgi:hypothetical protein
MALTVEYLYVEDENKFKVEEDAVPARLRFILEVNPIINQYF